MSRRLGSLGRLLTGGAVGRHIRVKSILLNSSRGSATKFKAWIELEMLKGMIVPAATIGINLLGVRMPTVLNTVLLFGPMAWIGFLLINAYAAAFRVNRAHDAYMKAIGLDLRLGSILEDRELWKRSGAGMTMRQFIAHRKATPARPSA